jgi:hypothetical protein
MYDPTPPVPHDNRPPAPRMPAVDFVTAANLRAVAAREAEALAARRAQLLREERALRHAASERAATRACVERKLAELAGREGVRA